MTKFEKILQNEIEIQNNNKRNIELYKENLKILDTVRSENNITYQELANELGYKSKQNSYKLLTNYSKIRNLDKVKEILKKKVDF